MQLFVRVLAVFFPVLCLVVNLSVACAFLSSNVSSLMSSLKAIPCDFSQTGSEHKAIKRCGSVCSDKRDVPPSKSSTWLLGEVPCVFH